MLIIKKIHNEFKNYVINKECMTRTMDAIIPILIQQISSKL